MTDLIDRAALVGFMDRVMRNMEADMLAAGNGAYIRGYRAALDEICKAPAVNARLIAAAPDLLDALRMQTRNCPMCKGTAKSVDAYTWLSSRGKEEPEPTDCRWCRDGRAAIDKATGAA